MRFFAGPVVIIIIILLLLLYRHFLLRRSHDRLRLRITATAGFIICIFYRPSLPISFLSCSGCRRFRPQRRRPPSSVDFPESPPFPSIPHMYGPPPPKKKQRTHKAVPLSFREERPGEGKEGGREPDNPGRSSRRRGQTPGPAFTETVKALRIANRKNTKKKKNGYGYFTNRPVNRI